MEDDALDLVSTIRSQLYQDKETSVLELFSVLLDFIDMYNK